MTNATSNSISCRIDSPIYINEYLRYAKPELEISGIALPALPHTRRLYNLINNSFALVTVPSWQPDIVHETYYSYARRAPRHSKVIVTVHDMIHEIYPNCFSSSDCTSKLKELAVARADHIICISENTRRDLVRLLGVPEEKTTVVHLGFGLTPPNTECMSTELRPFLLYVGSRNGYKNFDRLLAAFASRRALRNEYDLIAFGGGRFTTYELGLIRSFNLHETQVRQVSGDDSVLATLYKQAEIFVYPSLYEGFGIPPLEAMSFDCPVACSNTSSIPEVVDAAAVRFDPTRTESIANALVALVTDQALQAEMIRLGRDRIGGFSWSKCAEQTIKVYHKVLS
jgi:glycosyltransferase involved in cell wall biosynthesis